MDAVRAQTVAVFIVVPDFRYRNIDYCRCVVILDSKRVSVSTLRDRSCISIRLDFLQAVLNQSSVIEVFRQICEDVSPVILFADSGIVSIAIGACEDNVNGVRA